MKKYLFIIGILLFLSPELHAQITGGGYDDGSTKTQKAKKEKGVFKNSLYINFIRSNAIGEFGQEFTSYNDFRTGKGGMDKGFGIETGRMFFLNSIDLTQINVPENIIIGINIGASFNTVFPENIWDNGGDGDFSDGGRTIFISLNIGPLVSYNPSNKLVIDVKFTLQPTFILYEYDYGEWNSISSTDRYYNHDAETFALRKGIALNARFRPFLIGFEINWGKVIISSKEGVPVWDSDWEQYAYVYNNKDITMPTTRFDLKLGFAF